MDATAGSAPRATTQLDDTVVVRHSVTTRVTHWVGTLAFFVLVMSGLQIFNAAPYLDASVKSDPARRVLLIGAEQTPDGAGTGYLELFGKRFSTGRLLGYTDDGMGGQAPRAFPGWIAFPGFQDLADGRRWHLFFGWFFVAAGVAYFISGVMRKDLGLIVLRPGRSSEADTDATVLSAAPQRSAALRQVQPAAKDGVHARAVRLLAADRAVPGSRSRRASTQSHTR